MPAETSSHGGSFEIMETYSSTYRKATKHVILMNPKERQMM